MTLKPLINISNLSQVNSFKFIPIDYDYFDWQQRNYIRIIGRDDKGKRLCVIDSCDVYLWAILEKDIKEKEIKNIINKISTIKLDIKGRQTKVDKVEIHNKKFLDEPVKALKIFATNYKDLHDIADKLDMKGIEKRRGYDLGFETHYIIEKQILPLQWYEINGEILNNSQDFGGIDMALDVDVCIKLEKAKKIEKNSADFKPKFLAYDLECDEFQIGKGEILMISLVSENLKKVITWKAKNLIKDNNLLEYVEYVKDEAELIEKFVEHVKKISPDFLVGYFSDGFDLPYIKARAEKHKIKLSLGLDNSQPRFHRGNILTGRISGIVHLDLLRFIQIAYAQYLSSETLSLNEVANELIGERKTEFKFKHSSKIEHSEWLKYFEYNLQDSVLTFKLAEKIWPDLLEFSITDEEPIFDVSRFGLSKHVESFILHNLDKYNEIPEKRPTYEEIGKRKNQLPSVGAFVFQPSPGLYEDIVFFDFTSMHTSIIVSFNLSKGTLLEKKPSGKKDKDYYESPELEFQSKKTRFYFKKQPGFFPQLCKEIFEKRKKFKAEYKQNPSPISKARSSAFKVLSASVHGYVAFFGARYHSSEASNSILAFVRQLNKQAIEKTEQAGYKVIYADTDSIAFSRAKANKQEVKDFLNNLNSQLPGIMELELEDFYKRGIWVTKRSGDLGAKKKYALLDEKDNLKIRGFETVRRDWCGLAREVQSKVIKMILEEGKNEKALNFVKEIIKKIKNRQVSLQDLIIKTQLKKPLEEYKAISPHVIAARKMLKQGMPIDAGILINYYISETNTGKKKELVRDKVKLPEEKGQYDIEYYLNRQILPAVENIFQVFNLDLKEIIDGKKQTKLGDF